MTSCLVSRSISSIRATSNLALPPLSQIFFAAAFGTMPELGHGVGGVRLDLEPDAKARLRRPDRRHFGTGVAWDHRIMPRAGARSCGWPRSTGVPFGMIRVGFTFGIE